MKQLLGIVALVLAIAGCKKADEVIDSFTHFNYATDYVVKVPASPISAIPVDLVTPPIETHSDVAFSANKTRADLVQKVVLNQLVLSVKTPEGGNLQFLKSVVIYARAEGLPEVKVAFKDDVPADVGGTLSLDVTGVDLKEYFKKTEYQLRISVTSDQVISQDYEVNSHAEFSIDAKLLGE